MEKNRDEQDNQQTNKPNGLEHTAGVMADWFKIKLPVGAKLSDLIQALKDRAEKAGLEINIHEYLMRLNDKDVDFEDGKLKEDPVLTEASVLSLVVKKLTGGKN